MSYKISVLEEDGTEYNVPTERNFKDVLYKDGLSRYVSKSATPLAASSSKSFVTAGLSMTPEAGTYLYIFNAELHQTVSGINNRASIGLYMGGSLVSDSERESGIQLAGISLVSAAAYSAPSSSDFITVNGSQIVEARYRVVTGSNVVIGKRSLILVRIA